ncbi:PadR family transcriptional regulator [Stappia sp. ES.058]|uniref:PadR family transcriptional regulator n=1 Tax=Stappia sp. ES.058 TaxID=1881061 RepID=UPI00087D2C73|nr:PadR family transcriptional regulator [Stappia sp. ES.058]SDU15024.1 Transcriptional regulator PadR-like family protein [Stappia sp. ES.058]
MSVRTLCLAILNFGDATGYEIRKLSTEGRYSYFVDASFGSIYPALARLESDGLVTVREEAQSGKPSRKIYSITEAGREAFVEALSETPAPDTFRSPFLLVAMCADLVDTQTIRAAIDHRLQNLHEEFAKLDGIAEECSHAPTKFILDYGRHCMRQDIAFLTENRARIETLEPHTAADLPAAAE